MNWPTHKAKARARHRHTTGTHTAHHPQIPAADRPPGVKTLQPFSAHDPPVICFSPRDFFQMMGRCSDDQSATYSCSRPATSAGTPLRFFPKWDSRCSAIQVFLSSPVWLVQVWAALLCILKSLCLVVQVLDGVVSFRRQELLPVCTR